MFYFAKTRRLARRLRRIEDDRASRFGGLVNRRADAGDDALTRTALIALLMGADADLVHSTHRAASADDAPAGLLAQATDYLATIAANSQELADVVAKAFHVADLATDLATQLRRVELASLAETAALDHVELVTPDQLTHDELHQARKHRSLRPSLRQRDQLRDMLNETLADIRTATLAPSHAHDLFEGGANTLAGRIRDNRPGSMDLVIHESTGWVYKHPYAARIEVPTPLHARLLEVVEAAQCAFAALEQVDDLIDQVAAGRVPATQTQRHQALEQLGTAADRATSLAQGRAELRA